jgi:CheY-like chemotaxis protein
MEKQFMGTTVLIVDDSKLARIVLGKTIAALQPDWVRLEAGNADEAVAAFDTHAIDLAILDYNMPGRDGLALAEELRARYPTMPIAVATANVQDEVIARARAANATFIAKPVTEDGMRGFLSGAALRLKAVTQ